MSQVPPAKYMATGPSQQFQQRVPQGMPPQGMNVQKGMAPEGMNMQQAAAMQALWNQQMMSAQSNPAMMHMMQQQQKHEHQMMMQQSPNFRPPNQMSQQEMFALQQHQMSNIMRLANNPELQKGSPSMNPNPALFQGGVGVPPPVPLQQPGPPPGKKQAPSGRGSGSTTSVPSSSAMGQQSSDISLSGNVKPPLDSSSGMIVPGTLELSESTIQMVTFMTYQFEGSKAILFNKLGGAILTKNANYFVSLVLDSLIALYVAPVILVI